MSNVEIPTKPYLIRALHAWCVDNGYTPHLAVRVDDSTHVPREYVRDGEITLNISPIAVQQLNMGNELIEFSARFGGVARLVSIPVGNVSALYARETGRGMTFAAEIASAADPASEARSPQTGEADAGHGPDEPPRPGASGRPSLRRVK